MTKSKKILALVAFATLFVTMTMSCSNNKNIVAKHHCIDEGEDDDGVICCPVETQAVFPLEEGLYAYIEKNLKYPEAAKE
ncbi:MAG: hypothetical protein LBO06_03955, partial [Bacteroidales bacterium]|nr:hypothetical protein [Bacteroidales bacterium]